MRRKPTRRKISLPLENLRRREMDDERFRPCAARQSVDRQSSVQAMWAPVTINAHEIIRLQPLSVAVTAEVGRITPGKHTSRPLLVGSRLRFRDHNLYADFW